MATASPTPRHQTSRPPCCSRAASSAEYCANLRHVGRIARTRQSLPTGRSSRDNPDHLLSPNPGRKPKPAHLSLAHPLLSPYRDLVDDRLMDITTALAAS